MEETTISVKKYILVYGSILGLIWIIYGVLRHITDNRTTSNWMLSMFELFLHIGITVFGIYKFKQKDNGFLSLWQAFKIGLGIALVCILVQLTWDIFFVKVISPETLIEALNSGNESASSKSQGENDYIFNRFLRGLIFNSTLGILISLLGGAIMQKNRDPF
ncbi:DUF4199 domain-containing protein [Aquimarina mytili]|uniref:DUF4199 domain-containing protein n=1 Tax=Aquimarina mytili TaxID=874423 RepID=A0A936ZUB1_9FLAO|nr:DUF4199 domain-containing protein [Aquimarina mytili]MBL0685709.1 DUF4199 domain-containing protein [Aquimarina mytili]